MIADIELNFDKDGKIKNDYKINGLVKDTNINILEKYKVKKIVLIMSIKIQDLNLNNIKIIKRFKNKF